jgi:hypothetical protein
MKAGHTLTLTAVGLLAASLLFSPLAYADQHQGTEEGTITNIEEVALSNMVTIDALVELLVEKEILTQDEILEKIDAQAKREKEAK